MRNLKIKIFNYEKSRKTNMINIRNFKNRNEKKNNFKTIIVFF